MKKFFTSFFCVIIFCCSIFAQRIDTTIVTPNYVSYYSFETRTPLFITYKLYKAGGKVSRKDMYFKTGDISHSATKTDYQQSGYDIGHMADAEDFAFSVTSDESTFRFYNALPQTPNLNRGTWKSLETKLRKLSASDSLLIICGGFDFNTRLKSNSSVLVPDFCFKIVKDLSSNKTTCYLFKNDKLASFQIVDLSNLIVMITYPDVVTKINQILKTY